MQSVSCDCPMSITQVPFCERRTPKKRRPVLISRNRPQNSMTCFSLARLISAVCLWSLAAGPVQMAAQTATQATAQPPAPPPAKPQFFGGTVTQLDASHITISRTPPGKPAEHRTFVITPKTKMSKSVKIRSRVTVRYQHLAEGDIALEVRLHPLMRTPHAS